KLSFLLFSFHAYFADPHIPCPPRLKDLFVQVSAKRKADFLKLQSILKTRQAQWKALAARGGADAQSLAQAVQQPLKDAQAEVQRLTQQLRELEQEQQSSSKTLRREKKAEKEKRRQLEQSLEDRQHQLEELQQRSQALERFAEEVQQFAVSFA